MKAIFDLVRRIEASPPRAADELRAFVAAHQFPLVDGNIAVFFFVEDKPVDDVYLLHWVFGLESRQAFERIPGTQAFWLALELPLAARIEYKFEVHRGERVEWIRDPLNPRQAFDPFGSNSVCPMTGYVEPAWTRPDPRARHGTMERIEVASRVWGDTRPIHVYLPHEYKPHKKYPLLVCHDGDDYRKFAGARRVLDNLVHRHEVAPLIVAFTSGSARRNVEYGANPRQVDFVVDELLPALEARWPISPDREQRGIMGASFGAVSSLFCAWHRPDVFGRLLLQSGSFKFTDVGKRDDGPLWEPVYRFVNEFRGDPARIKARMFVSCGTFESLIYYNRSLVPLLRDAGLEVRYVESPDGHNWINWRDRLRDGLTWLFPGHLWMYYE